MMAGDGFDVRSLALTLRSGAHIDTHRHPWAQLVFAASGVMRVSTDSDSWLTPATKAIWLPAGVAHRIDVQGEVAMRTLYIAPERVASLPNALATLAVEPLLRELILHIVRLGMLTAKQPAQARMIGMLIDLMVQARREDLRLLLPNDARARAAALRLQNAPTDVNDLASLARASGASLRTLQRIFPRETGLTLEAWRQKARLIHAMGRLSSGDRVTAAAFDSGYQNVGAFITAFSRHFGVTPGRYRSAAS
jgi:AraC-like DNA-binding protein